MGVGVWGIAFRNFSARIRKILPRMMFLRLRSDNYTDVYCQEPKRPRLRRCGFSVKTASRMHSGPVDHVCTYVREIVYRTPPRDAKSRSSVVGMLR